MPATLTYPGLYIQEIPSGVHSIAGATTSVAAFIDFFPRGPMNIPVRISSVADFNRTYGGLDTRSESSYGIPQFFLNGGQTAWVVRIGDGTAGKAAVDLPGTANPSLTVAASSEGAWGTNVQVGVDTKTRDPANPGVNNATLFNLAVREIQKDATGKPQVVATEVYRNLTMDPTSPQYAVTVVNNASALVTLTDKTGAVSPPPPPKSTGGGNDVTTPSVLSNPQNADFTNLAGANLDGKPPTAANYQTALTQGSSPLDQIAPATFNILCLPGAATLDPTAATARLATVVQSATVYCHLMNAFLIVDLPAFVRAVTDMTAWIGKNDTARDDHAAVYFPSALVPDALNNGQLRNATSGTLAGVYARTDASRGVWKAPAGTDSTLKGATLSATLTDADSGTLNPLGINTLRSFPIFGNIAWGARTLLGADQIGSDYKYIPVRRLASYIEESLLEALKWVVFEPNDEPLWAQIRLNVGAFLHTLFRQGAFQGNTPAKAYLVKCDSDTTTQTDINNGIVNILVGFAPLKPAEFVVIQIQQLAGQIQV